MRLLTILSLLVFFAGCAKSTTTKSTYRPGQPFTAEAEAEDRKASFSEVQRVDKTDSAEQARSEELALPVSSDENATDERKPEQAPKVELLLNQMKISDAKISVGRNAGLVRFTGMAKVDSKVYPVKLEGHLKQDSTADLINVDDGDDRVRAEVFCSGEVSDGYYDCDSLFVDLYFQSENTKFYREQLELQSEQAKKILDLQQKQLKEKKRVSDNADLEQDDESDIPDAVGPYVGRPERVRDLFALNQSHLAKPVDQPKRQPQPTATPKEQPLKKKTRAVGPSEASKNNASSSQWFKKSKEEPKKNATPAKPVEKKAEQPKVTVQLPKAKSAEQKQKPTDKPVNKSVAKPEVAVKESKILYPAKVILEVGDEKNRPTDQAVGGYGAGGKLENASVLPFEGDHYYFSQPQERHNYGAYDLVRVIKIMAMKIYKEIMPGVKIRITDIGNRKGGYLPPHKGHQNGLEADIGYLTKYSHDRVPQPAVGKGNKWLGTMMMKEMWELLKFLNGSDRVSLVYVNKVIKPRICSYAKSIGDSQSKLGNLTLRKVVPISSHETHFHLRMECGRYNPRCRTDGPPASTTGC